LAPAALEAQEELACIPTCDVTDSRMLAVTPEGVLASLSPEVLSITIAIAGDRDTFELGVFDGDGGNSDPANPDYWDLGESIVEYRLFEDPEKDGVRPFDSPIRMWSSTGGADNAAPMPDNDWFDSGPIATAESARAESGNFFYTLEVDLVSSLVPDDALAAFKIRSTGPATIEIFQQPFAYIASLTHGFTDARVVYPEFLNGSLTPTTFDGTISFFIGAETTLDELVLFDGDLDYGNKVDGGPRDTNDPDTPDDDTATPFVGLPELGIDPWALDGPTFYEGIGCSDFGSAQGGTEGPTAPCADGRGEPEEDSPNPIFQRSPAVEYQVISPDGRMWRNTNPSGNREWEQFRIGVGLDCEEGVNADYCEADPLPAGVYEVRVEGLDLQNLNFFFFTLPLRCALPDGSPCEELRAFRIGDTVWEDRDGSGEPPGAGEPGIPAVVLDKVDLHGAAISSTVTDNDGLYGFDVDRNVWTVRVRPENFDEYAVRGTVGDRVWLDIDGDGDQDAGEPGIPSVGVWLLDVGANGVPDVGDDLILGRTVTDANGNYLFTGLAPGTYFTTVIDTTLPAGLSLSGGIDPSETRTITASEIFLDLDFGYTSTAGGAVIGDFVWLDADNDGKQDPGEAGLGGVTLDLIDLGGDGAPGGGDDTVVGTATTSGGYYLFTNVATGDYVVDVTDTAGVLSGYALTVGADSRTDPTAPFAVADGDAILTKDFGYFTAELFAISDVTWYDTDRDGFFDGGEPAIGGVTVTLLDGPGDLVAEAVSAADGGFSFTGLRPGRYTILITDLAAALNGLLATTSPAAAGSLAVIIVDDDLAGINFGYVAGGNLQGAVATTESPTQTDEVIDANVLDYDFGYRFFGAGTGTPGYWKNHPEAWPVSEISIGGVVYTRAEAIYILDQGAKADKTKSGDKTYTLGMHLITAKLNTLMGNDDTCISYTIFLADQWLVVHPVGSNVRGHSKAWKYAEPLSHELDDYNNGRLCAPHRD
jgi:hypothetical protein